MIIILIVCHKITHNGTLSLEYHFLLCKCVYKNFAILQIPESLLFQILLIL